MEVIAGKPNYTQVPNVILDNIFEFTHTEFKIIMLICRQTFGWRRDYHHISFSFLQEGCGLCRESVNNALVTLLSKNILVRQESGNSFKYGLNVSDIGSANELVRETDQSVKRTDIGSANELILLKSVRLTDTKKEREERKEIKEGELPIDSKPERKKFKAPELSEVKMACLKRGLSSDDGEWFWNNMMGKDWMVSGAKVKSWIHTLASWKSGGYFPSQKQRNGNSFQKPNPHQADGKAGGRIF